MSPYAVMVEIWRKEIVASKSADEYALLYADVEVEPPTPTMTDLDLMPVIEAAQQNYQCWTEDERDIRKGDKLVWDANGDVREFIIQDLTDPFDVPVGRTARRMHLIRVRK